MGNGPVIVFLHGWGQDWQSWSPLIGPLSAHYSLLLLDLPGFGTSDCHNQAWNSFQYADWLAELLHTLQLTPYAVVGHSFGAKISALFAAKNPHALTKLILIGSAGLPDPLSPSTKLKQQLIRLVPEFIKNNLPHQLKLRILGNLGVATDHANSLPHQKNISRLIVQENIANQLKTITTPTLLIWGEQDTETPIHQAQAFHSLLARSELVIIKDADHFVFTTQPQQVLAHLHNFLNHA
jgi:pimeloyl-ACP methyl ester carboxylesterase